MMFAQWPSWLSRSPAVRRPVIKLWRLLLRVLRATSAQAVLVVRRRDGRVLVLLSPSGDLRLPVKQLDAWIPIPTQVEIWLEGLIQQSSTPSLVAVDGSPGKEGVTFLYGSEIESVSAKSEDVWLDPEAAAVNLRGNDHRLLLLCTKGTS
jgi:hypothetical protein